VSEVARSVGYENAAAFATAFKRSFGRPPRRRAAPELTREA
jgi:AraC-like DNA-binding protein